LSTDGQSLSLASHLRLQTGSTGLYLAPISALTGTAATTVGLALLANQLAGDDGEAVDRPVSASSIRRE
jgi:hypothetical protein